MQESLDGPLHILKCHRLVGIKSYILPGHGADMQIILKETVAFKLYVQPTLDVIKTDRNSLKT